MRGAKRNTLVKQHRDQSRKSKIFQQIVVVICVTVVVAVRNSDAVSALNFSFIFTGTHTRARTLKFHTFFKQTNKQTAQWKICNFNQIIQ